MLAATNGRFLKRGEYRIEPDREDILKLTTSLSGLDDIL